MMQDAHVHSEIWNLVGDRPVEILQGNNRRRKGHLWERTQQDMENEKLGMFYLNLAIA